MLPYVFKYEQDDNESSQADRDESIVSLDAEDERILLGADPQRYRASHADMTASEADTHDYSTGYDTYTSVTQEISNADVAPIPQRRPQQRQPQAQSHQSESQQSHQRLTYFGGKLLTPHAMDDDSIVTTASVGSMLSNLASNTVLQPNFTSNKNMLTVEDETGNESLSEFAYLEDHFPGLTRGDVKNLYGSIPVTASQASVSDFNSRLSTNLTAVAISPNAKDGYKLMIPDQVTPKQIYLSGNSMKKPVDLELKFSSKHSIPNNITSRDAPLLPKPTAGAATAATAGASPDMSFSKSSEWCTGCFYLFISVLSIFIVLADLTCNLCLLINVYYDRAMMIYFWTAIVASSLSVLSYTGNGLLFIMYSDYCACAGVLAPFFRFVLSLPPFGAIFTMLFIPGVHALPIHMLAALVQYILNLMFMMTNTADVITRWNVMQLICVSANLVLSPMFAWLQQSSQIPNMSVGRCIQLIMLWLCSISTLTVLELINIFPEFMARLYYYQLDQLTFYVLCVWSAFCRLIFVFIFVDADGKRLGLLPLRRYRQRRRRKRKAQSAALANKHRTLASRDDANLSDLCSCTPCKHCCQFIGYIILQIFYFMLPLLPTAGIIVRLYKQNCVGFAQWNHLCMSVYLVLTYLPMLYLLIVGHPGFYTMTSIAIAYGCTVWVCLFLPMYLRKWKEFRW